MTGFTRHDYAEVPRKMHPHVMFLAVPGLLALLVGAMAFAYAHLSAGAMTAEGGVSEVRVTLDPEDGGKAFSYLFPYFSTEFDRADTIRVEGIFTFADSPVPSAWQAFAYALDAGERPLFVMESRRIGRVRYLRMTDIVPELHKERQQAFRLRFSDLEDRWIAFDPRSETDPFVAPFRNDDPFVLKENAVLVQDLSKLGFAPAEGKIDAGAPTDATTVPERIGETIAVRDEDGDGLVEILELLCGADPDDPDTDGDGYSDGEEVENGYDPAGEGKLGDACAIVKDSVPSR